MKCSTVRSTILIALGLLCAPLAGEAQPPGNVVRVGMLIAAQPRSASFIQAFEHRLRDLGYVEGQNLLIEFRTGEGKAERYPPLAAESRRAARRCAPRLRDRGRAARREARHKHNPHRDDRH